MAKKVVEMDFGQIVEIGTVRVELLKKSGRKATLAITADRLIPISNPANAPEDIKETLINN